MKKFHTYELKNMKAEIVLKKQSGMTIKEIAEDMIDYCEDDIDINTLTTKIKTQWDNYVKKQRSILDDDEEEPEIEHNEHCNQVVTTNKSGTKDSEVNVQAAKIDNISTCSADKLLELHGFLPVDKWQLISARSSQWQAQGAEGEIIDMVSSKISVSPVVEAGFDAEYDRMFADANKKWKETFNSRKSVTKRTEGDKIIILPLADFHLDKREANNSCMSFEKQVQRFYAIVDWYERQILSDKNIGKAVFFWSQDFFNYDYMTEETTSRRNKQDSSVGYNRMVQEGNILLFNAINQIAKIVPVELFYTRSNHDQHTAFNTMCSLYLAFKNDNRVVIDGMTAEDRDNVWNEVTLKQKKGISIGYDALFDSASRSYLKWGECLFGFGHGDKEGQRIFNMMQSEANNQFCTHYAKKNNIQYNGNPNMLPDFDEKFAWDKTFVHTYFCGHFHSKQRTSKDEAGVEVIYCGTEMTGDAWHEACGYIGAQRRVEAYTYTKDGDYDVKGIQTRNLKADWEARTANEAK